MVFSKMSESKTKLHVGRDGTPRTCVAQPGNCPVAPGIGHFAKAEQAEAFADKLTDKQYIIKNGGHINAETGYTNFEEILKEI